jgi:trafficking protein particle complex subunit 10
MTLSIQILATARLSILSSPFAKKAQPSHMLPPIYAGQPISALLNVRTSLGWGGVPDSSKTYKLRFDIEETVSDWLISGQKRGEFQAKVR